MRAQLLTAARRPLVAAEVPAPRPGPQQVLIAVRACAVCRTDLHVVDGELADPKLPLVPGHEIVGIVVEKGEAADRFTVGDRVGVPWLGWTCGVCDYCCSGQENLCDRARFTGYQIDGGYAELTVADERYCFAINRRYGDVEAAPLMCAGLIGYRTLRMAGDARRIGIYGFGAAAHIVAQVARHQGRRIFAFTRPGDVAAQDFALSRCGMGGRRDSAAARAARRGADLCTRRAARASRARRHEKGWHRRLRRYPYERHPDLPVPDIVGGEGAALGGQPDPARRRGISGTGTRSRDTDRDGHLPDRPGERGGCRSVQRRSAGCRRTGAVISPVSLFCSQNRGVRCALGGEGRPQGALCPRGRAVKESDSLSGQVRRASQIARTKP